MEAGQFPKPPEIRSNVVSEVYFSEVYYCPKKDRVFNKLSSQVRSSDPERTVDVAPGYRRLDTVSPMEIDLSKGRSAKSPAAGGLQIACGKLFSGVLLECAGRFSLQL